VICYQYNVFKTSSSYLRDESVREGDAWVLNGQKKWIGNSPWCEISIIWARDLADNQVKAFMVENKTTPGFSVEKIQNKFGLKVVQNGLITLKDVRLPEENHIQADGQTFRDYNYTIISYYNYSIDTIFSLTRC
jgi:alkylation response protein AidB-like acyl-CoA dehydrogenase